MTRPLVIVAIAGIATSVVSFSVAAALRPLDLDLSYDLSWPHWRQAVFSDSCPEAGAVITKTLSWTGDTSRLAINIPATVTVSPGDSRQVIAEGPAEALDHLEIEDGKLRFQDCSWWGGRRSLSIRISGPAIPSYAINGAGELDLQDVRQKEIEIDVNGAGRVSGTGTVESATIKVAGSGRLDLGGLAVNALTAKIAGSGRANLAPSDSAEITIAGSARVHFATRPKQLKTHIAGSGRID